MKNKVAVIGAGGHAKVIVDIIEKNGDEVVCFIEELGDKKEYLKLPVFSTISSIIEIYENLKFVIGIGDNSARERISAAYNLEWYTAIHPNAVIGSHTIIGKGTVVMANVVINSYSRIGEHTILNTGSIVEHDCVIGNYVHISPKVAICGNCIIGHNSWIGAGATVINNIKIVDDTIIGAGTCVLKNIEEKGTYVGSSNACRKIK